MEITWYGLTCFRLSERGMANVVTDPFPPETGLTYTRPRGQIITVSIDDPRCRYTSGVRGPSMVLDTPGEYEIGSVFITSIATYADKKKGAERGQNNIFTYTFDDVTVCHLGHLGHVPTQSQVESLGAVDVLLVPVGGGGSLSPSQASELISLFEPGVVIPMFYKTPNLELKLGTLDRFLKEMGQEKHTTEETYKVTRGDLADETMVVVLEPKGKENGD